MKKIEVPGLGILEFPDGMSEEEMANAIDAELAQQNQPSGETQQPAAESAESAAPGPFDLSDSQSAIRQIADPLAAGAAVVGNAAYDTVKYAATHPFETGMYATGASFIPGVNKLPVIRDIKSARERYFGNQQGPAVGPIREGSPKAFTPGTGEKIPITPSQPVQPGGPGQPPIQTQSQPGQFARGQFNMPQQPSMNTGMPAAPDKAQIFSNPNAGNYIERMSELSKTYAPAQQVVQPQPQTQPQPKPSGFPRGTFRGGGGGGGGGGGMVFDPTNRRKPLQF
jgi:hypothetical protein